MKANRVIGILMIASISMLGIFVLSCSNPLTDIIMNNSRALDYPDPGEPEPIGDSDSPLTVPIYAGKTIDVGTVKVWIEEDMLYVQFDTTWFLTETHLDVVADPIEFPQTKKGNPKPGQFSFKTNHEPGISAYTYQIPMIEFDKATTLYFAAHSKVEKWIEGVLLDSESAWAGSYDFPGANWATYFAGIIPEPGNTYDDGRIEVVLSDYPAGDGHQPLMGLFPGGSDPYDPTTTMIAMGGFDIVGGGGSCFLIPSGYPGGTELDDWMGTGGVTYDLYIWFDLNDNVFHPTDPVLYPEEGEDAMAIIFPYNVLIDGDVTISLTGDNIVGPEPGDIVGEWLVDGIFLYTWVEPGETIPMTLFQTIIFNSDLTFTVVGTGEPEQDPEFPNPNTIVANGTYAFNEVEGTLTIIYENFLFDDSPINMVVPTLQYEIQGDILFIIFPEDELMSPAVPLEYIRQ